MKKVSSYICIILSEGFYDRAAIKDMLKECSKMSIFNHPNVLTLRGVCLDGGPSPFIIMPFMNNGSLLSYLKKNRATLVVSEESTDKEEVMDNAQHIYCSYIASTCRRSTCMVGH